MTQEKNLNEVFPFGQTERVGNFKLWRGKWKMKTTDGTTEIDCVHISDLAGSWSVRIPSTYEMYGIITSAFVDYKDEEKSEQGLAVLRLILSNMMFASVVGNGYFQRGIELLATAYAYPSILTEDDEQHESFVKDVRHTIEEFLQWRKEYDEMVKASEPTAEDMHRDDLAEQAADIIGMES